jgi:hypothetical protein
MEVFEAVDWSVLWLIMTIMDYPPSSSTEVQRRVELYLLSPSVLSWHLYKCESLGLLQLCELTIRFLFLLRPSEENIFWHVLIWSVLEFPYKRTYEGRVVCCHAMEISRRIIGTAVLRNWTLCGGESSASRPARITPSGWTPIPIE